MTMVSSGAVSFGGNSTTSPLRDSINIELLKSATATLTMNDSLFRTLAGVPSGAISVSNVYGKTYTRYGTPGGSFNRSTGTVILSITNGMPNVAFNVVLQATTSGQPAPGQIATSPSTLNSSGNWSQSYNVAGSPYWYPGVYTNTFYFYQGASYPGGTFIGAISL